MSVNGPTGLPWNQQVVQNAVRESTQHDEVAAWRHHVLDVRHFHDPDRGLLRAHCGYHWGIIDGLTRQQASVDRLLRQLYQLLMGRHPASTLVVFICRSGRHRAVAWAVIFQRLLSRWYCPAEYCLSEHFYVKSDFYTRGCRSCNECRRPSNRREDAIDRIGSQWRGLFGLI
jgi:hypothetical protein